jgi:hypothetical protein
MLGLGYFINVFYPKPCANLPFFITKTAIRPVFLFALAYLTLEKTFSTFMGTRIRGV